MPRATQRGDRGRGRGRGRNSTHQPSPRPSIATSPSKTEEEDPPPFFSTTFSTHRASPLHIGEQDLYDDAVLRALSGRLRDTLIGDVVRGVHVGLEPGQGELGQAGSLEFVALSWVKIRDVLPAPDPDRRPPSRDLGADVPFDTDGMGVISMKRCLWIDIEYENATATGLLLPDLSSGTDPDLPPQTWSTEVTTSRADPSHFIHLPLLLLRMPTPLKTIVVDWLSSVFDCHISSISLGTHSLVSIWERWLRETVVPNRGMMAKDVVLTLGFSLPQLQELNPRDVTDNDDEPPFVPAGIRTIDITIAAEDIRRFSRAGDAIAQGPGNTKPIPWTGDAKARKWLSGGNNDDGWAWKDVSDKGKQAENPDDAQPFFDAVARYLDAHLALNLFHPSVKVTKIASQGFVLTESRLKVLPTTDAKSVYHLLGHITRRSIGPESAAVF